MREEQNLRVFKTFFGGYLFVFVEYLCNRSPNTKTKNIKNYSSILALVNHRNWPDDSPPSKRHQMLILLIYCISSKIYIFLTFFVTNFKILPLLD